MTIAITKNWTSSVPDANRSGAKAVMKAFVRVSSKLPSTRVMFAGTPSRVVASCRLRMLPFSAKYTDLNGSNRSLKPGFEHSYTGTVTAYFGVKLWRGFTAYWVPEVIVLHPLSNLTGLGGAIQNFELQKSGSALPTYYNSRFYFRQVFDLGGYTVHKTSDPMQVQEDVKSRRFVVTFGNFSILDFMDKNSFAGDLRRQVLDRHRDHDRVVAREHEVDHDDVGEGDPEGVVQGGTPRRSARASAGGGSSRRGRRWCRSRGCSSRSPARRPAA